MAWPAVSVSSSPWAQSSSTRRFRHIKFGRRHPSNNRALDGSFYSPAIYRLSLRARLVPPFPALPGDIVAPNPQEWKQVARSLGKSEAYIGRVIAVTKSGQSLGGQATEAMQHDLGAYSQTSAQLWQWHGAAKALGKSDTYLNRIAQVAIAFHHPTQGVPVPPRAVAIMQQDILAEQELTTTISRSQEQAVERQALLLQSLPEQSQNGRSLQLPPQQLWQHYSQNCTAPNPVSQLLEVARAAWQQGIPETQIRQILQASLQSRALTLAENALNDACSSRSRYPPTGTCACKKKKAEQSRKIIHVKIIHISLININYFTYPSDKYRHSYPRCLLLFKHRPRRQGYTSPVAVKAKTHY